MYLNSHIPGFKHTWARTIEDIVSANQDADSPPTKRLPTAAIPLTPRGALYPLGSRNVKTKENSLDLLHMIDISLQLFYYPNNY